MSEAPRAEHFRLFVALSVPEAVKDQIECSRAELRRAVAGPGIRWTSREQLHLTLRFLGNVESQRLDALVQALRQPAAAFPHLQMCASGIGFFPQNRPPRVVWAGVQDQAGRLAELQSAVQTATAAFTSEHPEATFTGHVTLGRIKHLRRTESEALDRLALAMANRSFGQWVAPEVELFRSQLGEPGAIHTRLAALPLTQESP